MIVGGGIANTFLAALGFNVGKSLHEPDMLDICRRLIEQSEKRGIVIPMPTDVVVATEFSAVAEADVKPVGQRRGQRNDSRHRPGFGRSSCATLIAAAGTILWNGPVGVFEFDQFGEGTRTLANAIARSKAFSLAGGGDTLAAIEKYGIEDSISYISTGGGAFLEFVEGKKLPAVDILEQRGAHELHPAARQDRRDPGSRHGRSEGHRRHGACRGGCGARQFLARRACRSCAPARSGARGRAPAPGRYVGVLGDLQGPKIRIDRFAAGKIQLADGAEFTLDASLAVDAGDDPCGRHRLQEAARPMCSPATCCC